MYWDAFITTNSTIIDPNHVPMFPFTMAIDMFCHILRTLNSASVLSANPNKGENEE